MKNQLILTLLVITALISGSCHQTASGQQEQVATAVVETAPPIMEYATRPWMRPWSNSGSTPAPVFD